MKRTPWLRFFLSYLFVFLFLSISLSAVFLIMLGQNIKNETKTANQVYSQNVVKTFDEWLNGMEQTLIRETLINVELKNFYNSNPLDQRYSHYLLYSRFRELLSTINGVDSFYLYRASDQFVLSDSHLMPLDDFADREFVTHFMSNPGEQPTWTTPRSYRANPGDSPQQVVSLVKGIPFNSALQGMLVINIPLYSFQDSLMNIAKSDIHSTYLSMENSNTIIAGQKKDIPEISSVKSEATGWVLHSGLKSGKASGFLSFFSYSWLLLAGLIILSALFFLFIVFRRNYKPINAISSRIQSYLTQDQHVLQRDQFTFIETAIDRLIRDSQLHEEQTIKDWSLKKRYLFRDLITGTQYITQEEWKEELAKLRLPVNHSSHLAVLVQIDQYAHFKQNFTEHDQVLLKFALRSVVQEISEQHQVSVWIDWIADDCLCSLLFLNEDWNASSSMLSMFEELRCWVEKNLMITVTVSLGDAVKEIDALPESYSEALQRLDMKLSIGHNRVITSQTVPKNFSYPIYDQLESLQALLHCFRTGNKSWEDQYHALFIQLKATYPSRSIIQEFFNYLIHHFTAVMSELSDEVSGLWNTKLPLLHELARKFSSLDELEDKLHTELSVLLSEIITRREKNPQYHNLEAIKAYIEERIADPGMSLNQISDQFGLTPQHFSSLFKELQGEKFIDYLIRVRIEKAKELLQTTGDSIQDIALQVGYVHAFSFIRTFKRVAGSTPGEFRKSNDRK